MTEERWTNNRRSDGCAIVAGISGWVVMPGGEGLPVDKCPCCDKPFPSGSNGLRAAKLVADILYPMNDNGDDRPAA